MRRMFSEKQIKGLAVAGINEATEAGQVVKIDIENLIDKDGHKRFLEGDLQLSDSIPEGVSITYAKWSLSGSHLMFVLAGNIADTTELSGLTTWAYAEDLPEWIFNKIYPVYGNNLEYKSVPCYALNWSTQSININISKWTSPVNRMSLQVSSTLTFNADRAFRVTFDILIDNE